MDRYEFSAEQSALLEHLQVPFAVYQYINRQVVTLILSDGFLDLIGYTDREQAYYDMDHNMYKETHPDDVARITDAAFRFATEGRAYDVLYRMKRNGSEDYHIIHAAGKHIDTPEGVRLAHIWYTDEGIYIPDENGSDPLFARSIRSVLDEQSALKDSYYDHLTGLPGMTYFFEIAESGKNTSQKEGGETALLFLDLCGMKYYNTKFGFAEGDNLIRGFAKLLSETFGSENCCRISADHFAVAAKREGLDTVCEGVETGEQVRFLQEIGCSKLQGYYYTKPISLENLLERYEKGIQIGFENPEDSGYYESIGRINLYDLTAVASEEETEFQNIFNILPMGVIEINKNDQVRYVRSNKNYRKFMKRFFHIDIVRMQENFECVPLGVNPNFDRAMWQCIENGSRVFFDDKTEDGITIRSLIRRIGVNPANGNIAMVIAVLSMIEDH